MKIIKYNEFINEGFKEIILGLGLFLSVGLTKSDAQVIKDQSKLSLVKDLSVYNNKQDTSISKYLLNKGYNFRLLQPYLIKSGNAYHLDKSFVYDNLDSIRDNNLDIDLLNMEIKYKINF